MQLKLPQHAVMPLVSVQPLPDYCIVRLLYGFCIKPIISVDGYELTWSE